MNNPYTLFFAIIMIFLYNIIMMRNIKTKTIPIVMFFLLSIVLLILREFQLLLDASIVVALLFAHDRQVSFFDIILIGLSATIGSLASFLLIPLWLLQKAKFQINIAWIACVIIFTIVAVGKLYFWDSDEKLWSINTYMILLFIWGVALIIQEFKSIKSHFGLQLLLSITLLLASLVTGDLSCLVGAFISIALLNVYVFPRLIFLILSTILLNILVLASLDYVDVMRVLYSFTAAGLITFIMSPFIKTFKGSGIITISGNSGTGKSTLAKNLSIALTSRTEIVEGDGDHKYERGHDKWAELTHLNPKANYIHRQVNAMRRLKGGYGITRSEYDHSTGKFQWGKRYKNPVWSLFVGLHTNYLIRENLHQDLSIHLEVDESLKWNWKYIRDRDKRGYTRKEVEDAITTREFDKERFIDIQGVNADINILYCGPKGVDHLKSENKLSCVQYEIKVKKEVDICRLLDYNLVDYDYDGLHISFVVPADFKFHLKPNWNFDLNYFCGFSNWEKNSGICQILLWILSERKKA